MIKVITRLWVVVLLSSCSQFAAGQQVIAVPKAKRVVMIDGKLAPGEWGDATEFPLGNLAHVFVKQSDGYIWLAAERVAGEDFALDFYLQPADGSLYDLHSSAKLGERRLQDSAWPDRWTWWNNDHWVANWSRVDSFQPPRFLPQKVREYQISRERFPGKTWRVMFELLLPAEPEWQTVRFPQEAKNTSTEHWIILQFK